VIPFYDTILTESVDIVRTVKPDVKQWLDTGCGTGYMVEKAAPLFPMRLLSWLTHPGYAKRSRTKIKIISRSPREVPAANTHRRFTAIHRGIQTAVITAILCHHYCRPRQRRIATGICYSLLESGGLYVMVEHVMPDSMAGIHLSLERWKRFQMSRGNSQEGNKTHQTF